MRYLLQRPLPDEVLSSVWVRSARRAGLPIGAVTRALTNGRKWAPSFFSAGHLSDLAPLLCTTPMDLLWQHTVFPYATAFFEPAIFENALAAVLATGVAATGMGAVTQSVSDQVRFRRFCPACAREDRKRWGESYWHRAHNLPGVLVCLEHDRVLRETMLPTSGTRSWSGFLPHELVGKRVLRNRPSAFEFELAKRSVAMLGRVRPEAPEQPELPGALEPQVARQPGWYRDALQAKGLLSKNRLVNVQKLALWARKGIGGDLTRLGFVEKDANLTWLGLMVRPKIGIPFVPLKHLVFETLLAQVAEANKEPGAVVGTLADAEAQTDAVGLKDKSSRALDHVPTGPSGRTNAVIAERDKQYAAGLARVLRGYRARGERVRVCDALTEAGCWAEFRHDREKFPRVGAVVLELRRSVASVRRAGA